jgi:hypothetical protein
VTKRSGKLIVLMDIVQEGEGPMKQTIEPFLAEYGVEVGNERLCAFSLERSPRVVSVVGTPQSTNPVAKRFRQLAIPLRDVRSVSAARTPPGFTVEPILQTISPRDQPVWKEPNLNADVSKTIIDALKKPEAARALEARFSHEPIPVAVAVGKDKGSDPTDPHASFRKNMEPRMVVFGDATWATDPYVGSPNGGIVFDIFSGSLSWLRDRPDLGTLIPPKERDRYVVKSENLDNLFAFLKWVPVAVMLVGIVGLGAAVWVVRRR